MTYVEYFCKFLHLFPICSFTSKLYLFIKSVSPEKMSKRKVNFLFSSNSLHMKNTILLNYSKSNVFYKSLNKFSYSSSYIFKEIFLKFHIFNPTEQFSKHIQNLLCVLLFNFISQKLL